MSHFQHYVNILGSTIIKMSKTILNKDKKAHLETKNKLATCEWKSRLSFQKRGIIWVWSLVSSTNQGHVQITSF